MPALLLRWSEVVEVEVKSGSAFVLVVETGGQQAALKCKTPPIEDTMLQGRRKQGE